MAMTIRELGKKCEEIDINCDICEYKEICDTKVQYILEDISPCGLLTILDKEIK